MVERKTLNLVVAGSSPASGFFLIIYSPWSRGRIIAFQAIEPSSSLGGEIPHWSSGSDFALSRRRPGFDSRMRKAFLSELVKEWVSSSHGESRRSSNLLERIISVYLVIVIEWSVVRFRLWRAVH